MHCSKVSKSNEQLKVKLNNSVANEGGYFGRSSNVRLK